jgi:hypothetical protein
MRPLIAFLLVAWSGAVLAQAPMYRSTMPDGKTVVSDRPMPGAAKVEEMKTSQGNYAPGSPVAKPATPSGPAPKSAAPVPAPPKPATRSAKAAEAEAELRAAQANYDAAVARAEKGRVETEGDRQGTAKGGARLTEDYEKRQQGLKAAVDAAQERLDAARRKYNAAR